VSPFRRLDLLSLAIKFRTSRSNQDRSWIGTSCLIHKIHDVIRSAETLTLKWPFPATECMAMSLCDAGKPEFVALVTRNFALASRTHKRALNSLFGDSQDCELPLKDSLDRFSRCMVEVPYTTAMSAAAGSITPSMTPTCVGAQPTSNLNI